MYFASRMQAGRMLGARLAEKYRYEDCVVIALNDGGVMVGAQIATAIHSVLNLLQVAEITLPRELQPIAGITSGGVMSYNHSFSDGEIEEMVSEYRGYIEQEKMAHMHDMNELLGSGGVIDPRLIRGRTVILVSDGMRTGFQLDLAYEYLKAIQIEKIIVATPLASVLAVDRMHILADDICCLSVVADYIDTNHYYDKQDVPDHATVIKTIEEIILSWK